MVKQRDMTGCGIACVACVAGKKYYDVRRWMRKRLKVGEPWSESSWHPKRREKAYGRLNWGTWMHHIRKALKHYGYNLTRARKFTDWNLQTNALLLINVRLRKDSTVDRGHWVIYNKRENCVYDPYLGKRTDFGRMNPDSYAYIR